MMITTKTTALLLAMTVLGVGSPIAAMAQDQTPTATLTQTPTQTGAIVDSDSQTNNVFVSQSASNSADDSVVFGDVENSIEQENEVEATNEMESENTIEQEQATEGDLSDAANVCTVSISGIASFAPSAEVGRCVVED